MNRKRIDKPIDEYMAMQKRFCLFSREALDEIKLAVDVNWRRLLPKSSVGEQLEQSQ